jgi:hypothetical protein
MKNTYLVTYQYNYGDPRYTKVKANGAYDAARIVEARRIGNYVLDVKRIG